MKCVPNSQATFASLILRRHLMRICRSVQALIFLEAITRFVTWLRAAPLSIFPTLPYPIPTTQERFWVAHPPSFSWPTTNLSLLPHAPLLLPAHGSNTTFDVLPWWSALVPHCKDMVEPNGIDIALSRTLARTIVASLALAIVVLPSLDGIVYGMGGLPNDSSLFRLRNQTKTDQVVIRPEVTSVARHKVHPICHYFFQ